MEPGSELLARNLSASPQRALSPVGLLIILSKCGLLQLEQLQEDRHHLDSRFSRADS